MNSRFAVNSIPGAVGLLGAVLIVHWLASEPFARPLLPREPNQDGAQAASALPPVDLKGLFEQGSATAADLPGSWPRFRGLKLDNISSETEPLARKWKGSSPPKLWSVEVGEGYAGAAIHRGRVYLLDYDQQKLMDVVRCLSLADGKEIWRRSYSVDITRNHGITRTVPAVTDSFIVTLGPKCHVVCLDADTGDFKWGIDLVREYNTTIPQWYAGQCPLIDGDRAILAPGGDALMIAVELATGKVAWKAPNPRKWDMTHSSIVPTTFAGKRMYVYCASKGVAGISAEDGTILWDTTEWKVNMANVPSPVPIGDGRIFLSGGYGAGSMMLKLEETDGKIEPKVLYKLPPSVFGAEQHTPILYKNHLYGLIPPDGRLVCLSLDGKQVWNSGARNRFGLGPFMIADGMIIVLHENGTLAFVEATEAGFKPLASGTVIPDAHEAWAPLALAGGRLIARDLVHMICLDVRKVANE